MTLCILGSTAIEDIHTPAGSARDCLGGSAVYAGLAASVLCPSRIISIVGNDFSPDERETMIRSGLDLRGVASSSAPTFRLRTSYGPNFGDPTSRELQLNASEGYVPKVPEAYRDSSLALLGNSSPWAQAAVLDGLEAPRFVAADTVDYWIEMERAKLLALLGGVNLLFVNALEAEMLTGEREIVGATRVLHELGPEYVIVKQGADGSTLSHGGELRVVPAYRCEEVRDPTGAGDSYAGGLMAHLARVEEVTPQTVATGMLYGTVLASHCVSDFGVAGLLRCDAALLERQRDELASMLR